MSYEPLHGTRVLDLTAVVVGPAATWRLGQYGAEIIKVESPEGDLMRGLGGLSPTGQHAGAYLHLNRGKRNICLNLKAPGAAEVVQRLINWADVIVANMRPQALARLGLDPETVCARHPEKIYCLLTGYGSDGPYGGFPTYDSVVQGAVGLPGLTLARDGAPKFVPLLICDHVVGEIAAGAILAALLNRQRTGLGVSLEVPMFETMAAMVLQEHLAAQSFDPPVGPYGDQRLLSPNNQPVKTEDGFIAITINTDPQVRAFLLATGRDDLSADPRFTTVVARAVNVAAWFEVRGAPLTQKTTEEWLHIFRKADLAAMPIHSIESLSQDPHLTAVQLITQEDHPTEGRTAVLHSSIRADGEGLPPRSPSAPRGWDTISVLEQLGYTPAEVSILAEQGAALAHSRDPDR
jgi:crotonobetainyl-CoA:carnitine CoA-transferase CaiB-like acyl-CoA transferase